MCEKKRLNGQQRTNRSHVLFWLRDAAQKGTVNFTRSSGAHARRAPRQNANGEGCHATSSRKVYRPLTNHLNQADEPDLAAAAARRSWSSAVAPAELELVFDLCAACASCEGAARAQ